MFHKPLGAQTVSWVRGAGEKESCGDDRQDSKRITVQAQARRRGQQGASQEICLEKRTHEVDSGELIRAEKRPRLGEHRG